VCRASLPCNAASPPNLSDQPIYVLEKDNDLNVYDLARQNARDILKVQPDGPYLLGGHSYGGTVAMEIAAVLESWGHDVGLVLVSTVHCC
jgi:thioesterase domain-containing protein